jgi:hypothetical protein
LLNLNEVEGQSGESITQILGNREKREWLKPWASVIARAYFPEAILSFTK